MALHAIILSGGHGTRLWPASRPARPKQFLPLLGARSMFQSTIERMAAATADPAPIVVAGPAHAQAIGRQLAQIGRSQAVLLVEPAARDSAPAIAAAAAWIVRHDPEGVAVMVASDHHLPDTDAFAAAVAVAVRAAEGGAIVTFGVQPAGPSEAYGYILPGDPLDAGAQGGEGAWRVRRFAEKPDVATAERYIAEGYLWNSGNFVFRAATLLDELDRHAPEVSRAARAAVEGAGAESGAGSGVHRLGEAFLQAPKISIDYAVMEKTDRAAVVRLDAAWSDLGAWDAVHAASARDEAGNAAPADAVMHEARGNLVRVSTGQRVAVLGLHGVAVIVEPDAILVADLAASQGVKQVVDRIAQTASPDAQRQVSPQTRLRDHAERMGLWLRASALPLWATLGADVQAGAFRESLDAHARPTRASRRLRVQGRQTYVYALAGVRGWEGPWREAIALGLRSIHDTHRLPNGGYATLVDPDGRIENDAVMLYDQAFVLLAGAWAKRAGVAPEAETQALALLDAVVEPRRNPAGGFREEDAARPWQSNPHMHLFEAALAWADLAQEAGGSPRWAALADEIARLALARFIDGRTGGLREFFTADWSPAVGADGRVVEPGHQFEWAWLLDRWAGRGNREDARAAARRLYAIGAEHGVDAHRHVAMNAMDDDFHVTDDGARLWPQTERLKAALRLADAAAGEDRARLLADAADAADGLALYLADVTPGLWRDKLKPDSGFVDEPAPASSLYHIACAVAELEDRAPRA